MYTKEELESMDVSQLMGIASELGLKVKQDDDLGSVVYAILDRRQKRVLLLSENVQEYLRRIQVTSIR